MIKQVKLIYLLKQIETPRLIIRPVQLGDEVPINRAIRNSLESLQKWQPWAKDPSIDATREFVQRGVFAWDSGSITDFPMVVVHKQDRKIIGASGYNDRSDTNEGLYEIGYWCDVDYQGKGLVTEYANALVRYAFDALNASKVVISMQIENEKSIAVARRLNFVNQGIKCRDPLDCVSDSPAQNTIYAISDTNNLPPLDIAWIHDEKDTIVPKLIVWAIKTLNIKENNAFASSKIIKKTPYSTVLAINTGSEYIYLKSTPELLSLESSITKILHDQFYASVPSVIANNSELNCFLMKDAGRPLREILKQQFDTNLFCKVVEKFTALQITVADNINCFLHIGVPDYRLDKLPDLYLQLLAQRDLLISDGLSEDDICNLEALHSTVSTLCDELESIGIKQTIVQPDFNDNNTLISDVSQKITFIDLGEIAISHPFFSLINCLQQIKKHHGLTEEDDSYCQIMGSCLKNFEVFAPRKQLLDAFKKAAILMNIFGSLCGYRLMLACGREQLMSYQRGKLAASFKEFIATCIDN